MKAAIALCVFFFAALALARPDGDHYTDRYDNIDVDEILTNPKLLKAYVDCLLDKAKCTPDGKELKGHMQEAMMNDCAKCTDVQKRTTKHVIKYMINKEQGYWGELTAKYDPGKKYAAKYEAELRESK